MRDRIDVRWMVPLIAMLATLPLAAQKLDMETLASLSARAIGPAGMSGRVTAIDVVLSNPRVIYVGTASGGLWRSESAGIHWEPIFDDQGAHSIGDVAVDQNNPDVIWVATGEGNPRNSHSAGNGVYKSLDGGRTWHHLGLEATRNIHRLILHPEDGNIAYAGATGAAWADTTERGLYKTTDGGATWEQILYVNERTGIGEMVMDPINPDKLIVATWEHRRWPWFFSSGGPGSGLHITFDGGKTWQERTAEDGLPKGELGRIGLAIAPSRPNVVYALVESKKNALYRSEDGGFTWQKTSDRNIGNRPFYYAEIYVDPSNENRVYNLYSRLSLSEDGGKTCAVMFDYNRIHPDHHAFWIHPEDPDYLINGNDGGLAISRDRGVTWRFVENLPLAQFYHINVDDAVPYNVYGGMQDNGSWRGPAYVWRAGGIRNSYWEEVAFGDGFDVVPDASNDRFGYAMSQGGFVQRYDLESGNSRLIRPVHPEGVFLRFNWNAAIAADPFDAETIYYGSQFLHKSTNRGDSWMIISPDLTTDDPEKQKQLESGGLTFDATQAENYTTIVAIEPSPLAPGVLWVGTDDGNVQLTRDGGETWTNVVGNIAGLPEGSWITQIRASGFHEGGAFVIADNHRYNDWTPYVFETRDFGKSWKALATADQVDGYALSLAQDPIEERLIFLGTELGLYVTIDGGAHWTKWTNGVPTCSVMDMAIQKREHDLVLGTFGRSAYVLDDIRPLRALAQKGPDFLAETLAIVPIPDTYAGSWRQAAGTRFAGEAEFKGENRPRGIRVSFVSNPVPEATEETSADAEKPKKKKKRRKREKASAEAAPVPEPKKPEPHALTIQILESGEVIRTVEEKVTPGLQRLVIDPVRGGVRYPGQPKPKKDAEEPRGMSLTPGAYKLRLTLGEETAEAPFVIRMDPSISVSEDDLAERRALYVRLENKAKEATALTDRLLDARTSIEHVTMLLSDREDETAEALKKTGKETDKAIEALLERFRGKRDIQGILRLPDTYNAMLGSARRYLGYYGPAGPTEETAVRQAEDALAPIAEAVAAFFEETWRAYREQAEAAELEIFAE